jgi:type II secretory pathway pseudopilin PulG
MNKKITILIAILIATSTIAGYVFVKNFQQKDEQRKEQSQERLISIKNACQLFTLADAKKLIGDNVKESTSNDSSKAPKAIPPTGTSNAPKDPAKVTTCTYLKDTDSKVLTDRLAAIVTVRTSSPEQAKSEFEANKTSKIEAVQGYGEAAFWKSQKSPYGKEEAGQLSILSSGNVILISGGVNDLELSKRIADIVMDNLEDGR